MENLSSSYLRPALGLAFGSLLLASCESKSDQVAPMPAPTPTGTGAGTNVYITNEGAFRQSTASVSFFDKTTKAVTADIFRTTNGRSLGDVAQSMAVYNNTGYVVVNNSNTVEVVSLPGFKSLGTITNLVQPRYMVSTTAGKGFVTEWLSATAGRVSIIDLATNTVTGTLPTGRNPEKPLSYNGLVYVPNSDENTLTVIDAAQGKVTNTITVSDGPSSLAVDKSGNIWVLCGGITKYDPVTYAVISSTPGALIRFAPGSPTVQTKLPFTTDSPSNLRISPAGDQLYYTVGKSEYRLDATATSLPTTPFISRRFSALSAFYGFDIDPKDNTLYVLDASFSGASKLIRYSASGARLDSVNTGTGSNGAVFY
jgi:YVTN family beta-propeller protein